MACSRGKAAPDGNTKLRLFADSAGYCQNPSCLKPLFLDNTDENIHVGEMAHILAASDEGPRADPGTNAAARGAYDNLILLCPTCHVVIDKQPERYPDRMIINWKREHKARIDKLFGAVEFRSRPEVRHAIEPLFLENRAIWESVGPDNDYRHDPESEFAHLWRRKLLAHVLPNNRKILAIADANRHLLRGPELRILELFRQHVDDIEARHLGDGPQSVGSRFPEGVDALFLD
jgi:hypothetical protein